MNQYNPVANPKVLAEFCDRLIWEIAEMIIYNKHPDKYDKCTDFGWSFGEIESLVNLENKIVVDVGAGTGKLSFEAEKKK